MSNLALKDLVIVNFGWVLAAPITSKYLADLGATVIRVESVHRPDPLRTNTPYAKNISGVNRSGYHALYNANNYSIALNLKLPKGIEIAKRLVSKCDIVLENFTPGSMIRMGLGYEELIKVNPKLIMMSLSMQGQTGSYSSHLGFGNQLTGLTGFTEITGWGDRDPVQPFAGVTDACVSSVAAAVIMSALFYRDRTGKGQYIDLSQNEIGLHYFAPPMLDYFSSGNIAGRTGNECNFGAPHAAYPCKGDDRWCVIAVFSDQEWEAFCNVLGNPAWSTQPEYQTLIGRKKNEKSLYDHIAEWTRNYTPEEVMNLLQKAGVAAGIVAESCDLLEDPQLKARNFLWWMNHPELGMYPHLGESYQLSKTPVEARVCAPALGEHTEQICSEILKMSELEFLELLQNRVFE